MEISTESEPIYGWRSYTVYPNGLKGDFIMGPTWTTPTLRAQCPYTREVPSNIKQYGSVYKSMLVSDSHGTRAEQHLKKGRCVCGIYMLNEYDSYVENISYILRYYSQDVALPVLAYCKGWGYIVEGTTGLRCQNVEILKLYSFSKYSFIPPSFHYLLAHDEIDREIYDKVMMRLQFIERFMTNFGKEYSPFF